MVKTRAEKREGEGLEFCYGEDRDGGTHRGNRKAGWGFDSGQDEIEIMYHTGLLYLLTHESSFVSKKSGKLVVYILLILV